MAGDISSSLALVREILTFLKEIFHHVCFCPGNNEMRLTKYDKREVSTIIPLPPLPFFSFLFFLPSCFLVIFFIISFFFFFNQKVGKTFLTSLDKFEYLVRLCGELDVHMQPVKVNDIWVVPLFAWYSPDFDPKWDGSHSYRVPHKNHFDIN